MGRRKRFALFGSSLTSRFKRSLCRVFSIAAEESDVDLVIFNTYGKLGSTNGFNEDYESEILDYFDLDQFDGIVFDAEGYNVDGMSETIERKLRAVKCPVISISSYIEGFYNIRFDDSGGLRKMVEHFIDHHHFTKIGYFSGIPGHPDAVSRLNEFHSIMEERGLPRDGAGIFEGDFWFGKGMDAAHFFLSLPERPEAIVCANDFMAISLINSFRQLGIKVPQDIAVSGYDGTIEGQEYLPILSTVTRERLDIARKALHLLIDISDNKDVSDFDLNVAPKQIYSQSCGCVSVDYQHIIDLVAQCHDDQRIISVNLYESESAMVKLNRAENVRKMESVFAEDAINFGDYSSFFLMVHTDSEGRPMYNSSFSSPSGKFAPVIWVDKNDEYTNCPHVFDRTSFLPQAGSGRSHVQYVMSVHFAEKLFGYAVVEMTGKDIFTEFYNVWLHNLGVTLNTLQKTDRINKLISELEGLSITDMLTGLYNRRGFDDKSRKTISEFHEYITVCTMVIDMDGLKSINDRFGHHEGDRAIKALADMIRQCCDSGEIAGRAGGDEFYIFAPDYSETRLTRFTNRLNEMAAEFNKANTCDYQLDFSFGAYLTTTNASGSIEEFLKISDARMYEQKMGKPGRNSL